jgi:very-short-patch-repair endonuclease
MTLPIPRTHLLALSIALAVAIGILLTVLRLRARGYGEPERFPFEGCRPMSERELVLYWRLRKVMPDQMVLAQVALSRILRVQRGHDARRWLNRIDRMTVDFLVCLPDGTIAAAIELDDASHDVERRRLADAKKSQALASAGIKLLRYREPPNEIEIRRVFLE